MAEKLSIIKLEDVVDNTALAVKNDELKSYLNQDPPKKWLRPHPSATKKITLPNGMKQDTPAEFLPIDKHEILLDTIFQEWKIEVISAYTMFHSICVTVRVHYKHPITHEWMFHDGVGAQKAQSDKDKPFNADTIKANAVQIGLPAAKSFAIKDATEHLGKLFGRDINRAATLAFEGAYAKAEANKDKSEERLELLMHDCKTRTELEKFKNNLKTAELRTLYDELWKKLK